VPAAPGCMAGSCLQDVRKSTVRSPELPHHPSVGPPGAHPAEQVRGLTANQDVGGAWQRQCVDLALAHVGKGPATHAIVPNGPVLLVDRGSSMVRWSRNCGAQRNATAGGLQVPWQLQDAAAGGGGEVTVLSVQVALKSARTLASSERTRASAPACRAAARVSQCRSGAGRAVWAAPQGRRRQEPSRLRVEARGEDRRHCGQARCEDVVAFSGRNEEEIERQVETGEFQALRPPETGEFEHVGRG